jgi:hypothetical protein
VLSAVLPRANLMCTPFVWYSRGAVRRYFSATDQLARVRISNSLMLMK